MKVKRSEWIEDAEIEVQIEEWPREGESEEHFEERIVRLVERLTVLDTSQPAEEKEGD